MHQNICLKSVHEYTNSNKFMFKTIVCPQKCIMSAYL